MPPRRADRRYPAFAVVRLAILAITVASCGGSNDGTLTIYTSVTQATVDAVVTGFEEKDSGVRVEVFRAPTGEVAARLETEIRSGDVGADVLWLTDPLSMFGYTQLLATWEPDGADTVPEDARTSSFWGTRILYFTIVTAEGNPATISGWRDLADPSLTVAIPDPRFAGSAFAALGYFGLESGFGLEFYEDLRSAGVVQVSSPGEVVTGVAEGRFDAGLTLEFSARTAAANGSPIEVVWPAPAAIAVYSPIGVLEQSDARTAANRFVEHVLSVDGQAAIGSTGWTPIRAGVAGPSPPPSVEVVFPDWEAMVGRRGELIDGYAAIFDG